MATQLRRDSLGALPAAVRAPGYRPAELKPGIVHFGLGNFHRAHQAVYLDDLFGLGADLDWAIVGAGVRDADREMRDKLMAQDWLTTVVEQEADRSEARVTGVLVDFVPPGNPIALVNRLADPAIRIVSLTITEGGYYIDAATQRFDAGHQDLRWDADHFTNPRTVFGLIAAGLKRRRDVGVEPFTVMSCDNIPGNGDVTRNAVVGLAGMVYPELAHWIEENVAFPNSMVDRITPATSDRERELVRDSFGLDDAWPVFCEGFRQWVLEDHFPAGRPALERVGVQFVDDVRPFELMKIRILNGGHAAIAYPGGLLDIHFVHEAMEEPLIRGFLRKLETEEIIPVVPPVPDTDLRAYFARIEERFANPKIGDTITRLCHDGSNRQPKFILPTAGDAVAAGRDATGLALVSAMWARYCYGESDSGKAIPPNDPNWERLTLLARRARERPEVWLEMRDIFGPLAENPTYAGAFTRCLSAVWRDGTRATLERYIQGAL